MSAKKYLKTFWLQIEWNYILFNKNTFYMIKMHSYVYHEFGAYCRETSDAIIFNFTLPTKQSSKHVGLGLFDSLLDESFGALFPFIKHFLHSCFKAGF